MGKHGWEVWSGPTFTSFRQNGNRYCTPPGWEPVGESKLEQGGATFPLRADGVMVKTSEFKKMNIPLAKNDFALQVLYPVSMSDPERDDYIRIISEAFNNVGTLYPKSPLATPKPYTVLITVGVAGDGIRFENSLYPNPSEFLGVMVRNKELARGEDLFVHAATHAYNRFYPEFKTYQDNQSPIPAGDFEEMEATWSEITFSPTKEALEDRVNDVYKTYEAVMDNNYSESILFPLSEPAVFTSVANKEIAQEKTASRGDEEFGHYILAPLVMVSIEGMLEEHKSKETVNSLLKKVHETHQNFFDLLKNEISNEELTKVMSYITGNNRIPRDLIDAGLKRH
jgi:hypothetical protein